MINILIEIRGGIIQSIVTDSDNTDICVKDFDVSKVESEDPEWIKYIPDSIMTTEGLKDYKNKT